MDQKKSIAISACLLGHKVRYDGVHQANALIIEQLLDHYHIIPVCPEVEIGLGIPREKIELHQQGTSVHLLSCTQPVADLTEQMISYARHFLHSHKISGMVLKDKSPSCGVRNCKQWNDTREMQRNGTGIFAATILRLQPDLPMLQSNTVQQASDLDEFLQQVNAYGY